MRNKNKLFFFVLILISLSCKEDNKIINIDLKKKLIHRISVDTSLLKKLNSFYHPLNSSNMYFLNKVNGDIYRLNGNAFKFKKVLKSELIDTETFSVDEKNKRFVLFTLDSFFVFTKNVLTYKNVIPVLKKGILFYDDFTFKPILEGDNIYLIYYHKVFDAFKNKYFFDKNFECSYNFKSKKIKILNVTYPKSFKENCFGHSYLPDRSKLNEKNHVYFYKRSDSISVYNKEKKISDVIFCGSKEKKTFKAIKFDKIKKYNISIFDDIDSNNPFYLYSGVLTKNNIVYRFYTKSIKHYNNTHSSKIILFDKNMNYLGESKFEKHNLMIFENSKSIISIKFNKKFIECYELSF